MARYLFIFFFVAIVRAHVIFPSRFCIGVFEKGRIIRRPWKHVVIRDDIRMFYLAHVHRKKKRKTQTIPHIV